MEKAKLMQLEIEQKRKLPKNVKDSISTNIFQNLLGALIVMAYLVAINITYYKVSNTDFEQYMKYFALGIILITVIDFEIAYRKNSFKFTLIGIELLICGILSLYIPYIYLHTTNTLRNSVMILPAILIIYYAFKSIIIFKQKQFHYQNNLSDVKEIVNFTENTGYLEDDSKKAYKEKIIQEEIIRKEILQKQDLRKKQKAKIEEQNKKLNTENEKNNRSSKLREKQEPKHEINKVKEQQEKLEDFEEIQEVKPAVIKSKNQSRNKVQKNRKK